MLTEQQNCSFSDIFFSVSGKVGTLPMLVKGGGMGNVGHQQQQQQHHPFPVGASASTELLPNFEAFAFPTDPSYYPASK